MKRVRPDIEPSIAYLCTRVKRCTVSDWRKLKRLLCWIKQTIDDVRIIEAKNLTDLYTWIDASYAVHTNMRGQTGGCMQTKTKWKKYNGD